ncbi:VWA domain-containing protein [Xanthobacter dioxanivorans]|uniref:VWA domain-containing protein n=1 Tax=Xanthobacter dioxanivorans TaxID=2528964 RepID=A0A974SJ67_9HYPH|nr:vWA domain-containing protein [Xanthobacter dioxanivorans]QRG06068.1 VWA domain-containing protein [Xanthobacter dioxanivorans]
MNPGVDHPLLLWLLLLALLPLFATPFRGQRLPAITAVPRDGVSTAVAVGLRTAGSVAIAALVLGLGGLHLREETMTRQGNGAHLMLLLDRSASMDNTFADRQPGQGEESKSAAAKRLLTDFLARRPRDRIGVAAFSTSPMPVLPLTDHHAAVAAAVAAIDRPGLALTDVGRGLALALSSFGEDGDGAARAVLLVSDGAALVDPRVQAALRDGVKRNPVRLYWLFLRTAGARGIFEAPRTPGEDTPQAMPERHLHLFFGSLGVSYRAFEAGSPQAVADAIAEIDRQEASPIAYLERIPRRDLRRLCFAVAALATLLLLAAKLAERGIGARQGRDAQAGGADAGAPDSSRRAA